jgi:hypothetical protein
MKGSISPKNLSHRIGFGKYKNLLVIQVYSGTLDIPSSLWKLWLGAMIRHEATPTKFSCSSLSDLNILQDEQEKGLGSNEFHLSIANRFFNKLEQQVNELVSSEFGHIQNWGGIIPKLETVYKVSFGQKHDDFYRHANNYDNYGFSLLSPLTEKECQLIEVEFAKDYLVLFPTDSNESWLDKSRFDFYAYVQNIADKYWNDEEWSSEWGPGRSSPMLVNLKETIPPIFETGREYVLTYGDPSYLDWALRETGFFITPRSLAHLEELDVLMAPDIILNEVAEDVLSWAVLNRTYKYKFSMEAKELNQRKYDNYQVSLEEDNNASGEEFERYTQQDAVDDAFGGEESAYWNID